jgi:hypothetical protein
VAPPQIHGSQVNPKRFLWLPILVLGVGMAKVVFNPVIFLSHWYESFNGFAGRDK